MANGSFPINILDNDFSIISEWAVSIGPAVPYIPSSVWISTNIELVFTISPDWRLEFSWLSSEYSGYMSMGLTSLSSQKTPLDLNVPSNYLSFNLVIFIVFYNFLSS